MTKPLPFGQGLALLLSVTDAGRFVLLLGFCGVLSGFCDGVEGAALFVFAVALELPSACPLSDGGWFYAE